MKNDRRGTVRVVPDIMIVTEGKSRENGPSEKICSTQGKCECWDEVSA